MALRVLDLFSGIGGWSAGLQRTGGFEPAAFCEINQHCRGVLARHWPGVPCFEDVRAVGAEQIASLGSVDALCAGFPCQDISHAGNRAGIGGERSGLWSEVARIAGLIRPDWVLLENVAALLVRGLDRVLGDLAALGYDAFWDCVPAGNLGYPHERDRIWIVAYPAGLRRQQGERAAEEWGRIVRARTLGRPSSWAEAANDHEVRSRLIRIADGVPDHVERLNALGNAVVPEIPELIGRAILQAEAA